MIRDGAQSVKILDSMFKHNPSFNQNIGGWIFLRHEHEFNVL